MAEPWHDFLTLDDIVEEDNAPGSLAFNLLDQSLCSELCHGPSGPSRVPTSTSPSLDADTPGPASGTSNDDHGSGQASIMSLGSIERLAATPSMCWGVKIKMAFANVAEPCDPKFVPGKGHLKNKFCPLCRQHGFEVPAAHVRIPGVQLAPLFVNSLCAGLWACTQSGVRFRQLNQTKVRRGDVAVLFCEPPPDMEWQRIPPEWLSANGQSIRLLVVGGTLAPKGAVRRGKGKVSQSPMGDASAAAAGRSPPAEEWPTSCVESATCLPASHGRHCVAKSDGTGSPLKVSDGMGGGACLVPLPSADAVPSSVPHGIPATMPEAMPASAIDGVCSAGHPELAAAHPSTPIEPKPTKMQSIWPSQPPSALRGHRTQFGVFTPSMPLPMLNGAAAMSRPVAMPTASAALLMPMPQHACATPNRQPAPAVGTAGPFRAPGNFPAAAPFPTPGPSPATTPVPEAVSAASFCPISALASLATPAQRRARAATDDGGDSSVSGEDGEANARKRMMIAAPSHAASAAVDPLRTTSATASALRAVFDSFTSTIPFLGLGHAGRGNGATHAMAPGAARNAPGEEPAAARVRARALPTLVGSSAPFVIPSRAAMATGIAVMQAPCADTTSAHERCPQPLTSPPSPPTSPPDESQLSRHRLRKLCFARTRAPHVPAAGKAGGGWLHRPAVQFAALAMAYLLGAAIFGAHRAHWFRAGVMAVGSISLVFALTGARVAAHIACVALVAFGGLSILGRALLLPPSELALGLETSALSARSLTVFALGCGAFLGFQPATRLSYGAKLLTAGLNESIRVGGLLAMLSRCAAAGIEHGVLRHVLLLLLCCDMPFCTAFFLGLRSKTAR